MGESQSLARKAHRSTADLTVSGIAFSEVLGSFADFPDVDRGVANIANKGFGPCILTEDIDPAAKSQFFQIKTWAWERAVVIQDRFLFQIQRATLHPKFQFKSPILKCWRPSIA